MKISRPHTAYAAMSNAHPQDADTALKTAALSNNRLAVASLLKGCTQQGINEAALAAAKTGAADSILEFLKKGVISGIYVHPMKDHLDFKFGTPLKECVWSVLIREASKKGYWEIARSIAVCKPSDLTKYDLEFLAIAAASAGKKDALQEFLGKVRLGNFDKVAARSAAIQNGHLDLLYLLA